MSAVLEISTRPVIPALYFWALQASFRSGPVGRGAGHIGLQHHPGHPGSGAVNWGGYHDRANGGGVLDGTGSTLHSSLGNANTFDYPWQAGVSYRLEIGLVAPGRWRGSVTDLGDGTATIIRDLFVDADHFIAPIVWTEAFADCDAAPVEAKWSSLGAATLDGTYVAPTGLSLSYQREADGGCSNTDTSVEDGWLTQRTSTDRRNPHGARLPW